VNAQHTPGPITMIEPPECKEKFAAWTNQRSCELGCRSQHGCVARREWHAMLEKVRAETAGAAA